MRNRTVLQSTGGIQNTQLEYSELGSIVARRMLACYRNSHRVTYSHRIRMTYFFGPGIHAEQSSLTEPKFFRNSDMS